MIRVCHVISGDLWAGAEVMTSQLLKTLNLNQEYDISVIILNHGRLEDELKNNGISVVVLDESKYSFFQLIKLMSNYFSIKNPNIFHSHRYKENLLSFFLSLSIVNCKIVATQHGLPEIQADLRSSLNKIKNSLNFFVLKHFFHSVVAVSEDIQNFFVNNLSFNPQRVSVVHNGIQFPEFMPTNIVNNSFVIGSSGRLFPVKDYPLMVEIARAVVQQGDVLFALAGDGPERAKLEDGIKFAKLESRFQLLGHIDDMDSFYGGLNIYMNTSVHEGIPMTILEAMARGLPIIAPRVGGIPEVVDDGVQGFLIEGRDPEAFAEKCLLLYNDRDLWQRMSLAAREKAERCFSVEKMAQGYLEIYRNLCGEKS